MLRIGFVLNFNKDKWRGGYEYIKNLIGLIRKLREKEIEIVILTSNSFNNSYFSDLGKLKIIKSQFLENKNFFKILHKILIILFGKNFFLEKFLIKSKINFLSHFYFLGKNSLIKNLYWIPDFQEQKMPKYLTFKQKIMRKINLYLASIHSTNILLSSETVKKDLKELNNLGFLKAKVLKPIFEVKSLNQIPDYKYIKKKYKIERNYFFLPNQYWTHKNHILILRTLSQIKAKNILIISTGTFNDYRNLDHKKKIINFIKKNNLSENYKILGIVPHNDLLSLMAYSIGVINPSKSEGWSSTVEQAKSYGKMVLLSNLDVHKEQNPERQFFFKTNDTKNLSKQLVYLNKNFKLNLEINLVKNALKKNRLKKYIFAKEYIELVKSAIK
jgi:hypothetical protein